jgi:hypothetical protein
MAEFEEIQRQRKLLGLHPLSVEEAAQLGRGMGQADAVQSAMQSAHQRAEQRRFPLRLAVLILLVSLGLFLIGVIVFK